MGEKDSGFYTLGHILAREEIKSIKNQKKMKKSMSIFLSLSSFQTALLGCISGAMVPFWLVLPLVIYGVIGIIYTLAMEFIFPGATGFSTNSFLDMIMKNTSFCSNIFILLIRSILIPSAIVGTIDISLRRVYYKQEKKGVLSWLYTKSCIPFIAITLIVVILFWKDRSSVFGIWGLLFVGSVMGWIFRQLFRSILLVSMDLLLLVIIQYRKLLKSP